MKCTYFVVFIVGCMIGFYTNVLLMYQPPAFLLQLSSVQKAIMNAQNTFSGGTKSSMTIAFDGKKFIPQEAHAYIGDRISIINQSTDIPMQLVSKTKELNTVRGYGEGEQFLVIINTPGEYIITVKDISTAKLQLSIAINK